MYAPAVLGSVYTALHLIAWWLAPEPVVIVAIWRINREVVHVQSTLSG